jgi:hypothetical protein
MSYYRTLYFLGAANSPAEAFSCDLELYLAYLGKQVAQIYQY